MTGNPGRELGLESSETCGGRRDQRDVGASAQVVRRSRPARPSCRRWEFASVARVSMPVPNQIPWLTDPRVSPGHDSAEGSAEVSLSRAFPVRSVTVAKAVDKEGSCMATLFHNQPPNSTQPLRREHDLFFAEAGNPIANDLLTAVRFARNRVHHQWARALRRYDSPGITMVGSWRLSVIAARRPAAGLLVVLGRPRRVAEGMVLARRRGGLLAQLAGRRADETLEDLRPVLAALSG